MGLVSSVQQKWMKVARDTGKYLTSRYAMPWHSEDVLFLVLRRVGGGGKACTSSKLFPTRCCHRLSSKVCRGSLEKVER